MLDHEVIGGPGIVLESMRLETSESHDMESSKGTHTLVTVICSLIRGPSLSGPDPGPN